MPPVVELGGAGRGRAVPFPLRLAGFGIDGAEKAAQIVEVAGDADQDVVADDERRHGGPVALGLIGDRHVPAHAAVFGVERDQMGVGSEEEKPVLIHADAAMADVQALVRRVGVVPDLVAGARVHRPDVVGDGEINNAVHQQRGGFDGRRLAGLKGPGEAEIGDVGRRDLREGAVAAAGIVAVVGGPGIGGRMADELRCPPAGPAAGRRSGSRGGR